MSAVLPVATVVVLVDGVNVLLMMLLVLCLCVVLTFYVFYRTLRSNVIAGWFCTACSHSTAPTMPYIDVDYVSLRGGPMQRVSLE